MKLQKILFWTGALVMVAANVWAATSGSPVAQPIQQWGHIMTTDVAYGAALASGGVLAHHCLTGRTLGEISTHAGVGFLGAVGLHYVPAMAIYHGMSAGALIY